MVGESRIWSLEIDATPERVWHALTDRDESGEWYFGTGVSSDWSPGSQYRYLFDDGSVAIAGEVLEANPPLRLSTTFQALWSEQVSQDAPSAVTWTISPHGSSCTVSVEHRFVATGSATEAEVASGWPSLLDSLKSHLEGGA